MNDSQQSTDDPFVRIVNGVRVVKPFFGTPPHDGSPWVCDWRSYDVPATVSRGIRIAPAGMLAISLSRWGGRQMVEAAEKAAAARGAQVLWWWGPDDPADIAQLELAILRMCGNA